MRNPGLAAAIAAVVATACSPTGGHEPAPAPPNAEEARAKQPAEPATPEDAPVRPPPRAAASLAIAVDQSASVAGFARTGVIQALVDGAVAFARASNIAADRVTFLSIGAQVARVSEPELWGGGRFGNAGADLAAALDAPEIAGSDLAVIVSDGQPTSRAASRAACSLLGAEDVSSLAPRLEAALDAGRGLWLVLEQAALDRRKLARLLAACLAKLAPAARDAVVLRYHQDLSYDEASAVAGDHAGTLQQRVARALPALRRCLDARLHAGAGR